MQLDEFNELMMRAINLAKDELRCFAYEKHGAALDSTELSQSEHETMLKNKVEISTKQYNHTYIKICKKAGLYDPTCPEKTNKLLEHIGAHLYNPVFKKARKVLTDVYMKTHNLKDALDQADSVFIENMISNINVWFGTNWTQNEVFIPIVLIEDRQVREPDLEVSSWMPDISAAFISLSHGIATMFTPPATPVSIPNESSPDESSGHFLSFFLPLSTKKERSPVSVTEGYASETTGKP